LRLPTPAPATWTAPGGSAVEEAEGTAHAERGGGLTLVLGYQVMDAVKAGRLEVVLPGFEPPPLPIQLVSPGTRLVSANVRAFVDLTLATRDWRFVDF